MKRKQTWTGWVAGGLLAGVLAAGAFAAQGTEDNPLVTLSYLREVVIPEILHQVEEKAEDHAARMKTEWESDKGFVVVELAAGSTVTLDAGTQLMVRSGEVGTPHPFADLTDGTTWEGAGSGLIKNHLYLSTGAGMTLTVRTDSVMLIQGAYSA